jgi:diguanylate cyclase (GGDEF)-like protein
MQTWDGRIHSKRRDGSELIQDVTVVPVGPPGGPPEYMVAVRRDVTVAVRRRKRTETLLRRAALHDSLTGLPNRRLLLDRMAQAEARLSRRPGSCYALLFFDLDRFKLVNDTFGHEFGDSLLITVAHRMRPLLRPEDTLARLGGDEFTVLLEDLQGEEEAVLAAQRLLEELRIPILVDGRGLRLSSSVGLAMGGPDDAPGDVLRNADRAMYRAKQDGGDRVSVFRPEMAGTFHAQLAREQSLREAVEEKRIEPWFQPIFSLEERTVVGFEALARWPSTDRQPGEFIPLAESTGLIGALGRAIADQSIAFAARWPSTTHADVRLAINLSTLEFHMGDIREALLEAALRHGVSPKRLDIEITESTAMRDTDATAAICAQLRDAGMRVVLDDFGTGFSSLSLLHKLPVDRLKIDRSFVGRLATDASSRAIVRTILGLADSLSVETVAEGIESEPQLEILQDLGCSVGQGWLFAPALPRHSALNLLH